MPCFVYIIECILFVPLIVHALLRLANTVCETLGHRGGAAECCEMATSYHRTFIAAPFPISSSFPQHRDLEFNKGWLGRHRPSRYRTRRLFHSSWLQIRSHPPQRYPRSPTNHFRTYPQQASEPRTETTNLARVVAVGVYTGYYKMSKAVQVPFSTTGVSISFCFV